MLLAVALGATILTSAVLIVAVPKWQSQISNEAETILAKFTVKIYNGTAWETYSLGIDKPYVKVLLYRKGGWLLSTQSPWNIQAEWQLWIGTQDLLPTTLESDFCDVIIKIVSTSNPTLKTYAEIACLGNFRKQVFYNGALKLDTDTSRWTKLYGL